MQCYPCIQRCLDSVSASPSSHWGHGKGVHEVSLPWAPTFGRKCDACNGWGKVMAAHQPSTKRKRVDSMTVVDSWFHRDILISLCFCWSCNTWTWRSLKSVMGFHLPEHGYDKEGGDLIDRSMTCRSWRMSFARWRERWREIRSTSSKDSRKSLKPMTGDGSARHSNYLQEPTWPVGHFEMFTWWLIPRALVKTSRVCTNSSRMQGKKGFLGGPSGCAGSWSHHQGF